MAELSGSQLPMDGGTVAQSASAWVHSVPTARTNVVGLQESASNNLLACISYCGREAARFGLTEAVFLLGMAEIAAREGRISLPRPEATPLRLVPFADRD